MNNDERLNPNIFHTRYIPLTHLRDATLARIRALTADKKDLLLVDFGCGNKLSPITAIHLDLCFCDKATRQGLKVCRKKTAPETAPHRGARFVFHRFDYSGSLKIYRSSYSTSMPLKSLFQPIFFYAAIITSQNLSCCGDQNLQTNFQSAIVFQRNILWVALVTDCPAFWGMFYEINNITLKSYWLSYRVPAEHFVGSINQRLTLRSEECFMRSIILL